MSADAVELEPVAAKPAIAGVVADLAAGTVAEAASMCVHLTLFARHISQVDLARPLPLLFPAAKVEDIGGTAAPSLPPAPGGRGRSQDVGAHQCNGMRTCVYFSGACMQCESAYRWPPRTHCHGPRLQHLRRSCVLRKNTPTVPAQLAGAPGVCQHQKTRRSQPQWPAMAPKEGGRRCSQQKHAHRKVNG